MALRGTLEPLLISALELLGGGAGLPPELGTAGERLGLVPGLFLGLLLLSMAR